MAVKTVPFQPVLCDQLPVILFEGKDEPVASSWLDEILNRYIEESLRPLNYVKKDANNFLVSGLIEILEELPMLANRRVVLVNNPDKWEAREQQHLAKYISNTTNQNLLVLWMFQQKDNRPSAYKGNKTANKKTGLNKELESAVIARGKIFTATLNRNEKLTWLIEMLQQKKITIQPALLDAVLEYTDDNLLRALSEAEKLALTPNNLYKTPKAENNENILFQLLDAIGTRDLVKICSILAILWRGKTEPVYVLSTIANHIRLLLQVAESLQFGNSQKAIADKLNIHPYRITKAAQQCKHYLLQELIDGLEDMLQADIKIKTGQLEPCYAVELAVVNLCQKKN